MGVIFTFLMGLFMSFEPITDNDFFWHMVIGRWVDVNKTIPTKELFSWWGTGQNYDWTAHEWLTEFIMYKLGPIGCIAIMLLIFFKMILWRWRSILYTIGISINIACKLMALACMIPRSRVTLPFVVQMEPFNFTALKLLTKLLPPTVSITKSKPLPFVYL